MGSVVTLTHGEAWQIGSKARELLLAAGKEACVFVVNHQGKVLFHVAMDEIRGFTSDVAFIKAMLSSETGHRTSTVRDKRAAGEMLNLALCVGENDAIWAGGVPIYDGKGSLLGAIGISNLKEEEDESIAIHAVEETGFTSDRK